jgi:hypothetical protein
MGLPEIAAEQESKLQATSTQSVVKDAVPTDIADPSLTREMLEAIRAGFDQIEASFDAIPPHIQADMWKLRARKREIIEFMASPQVVDVEKRLDGLCATVNHGETGEARKEALQRVREAVDYLAKLILWKAGRK